MIRSIKHITLALVVAFGLMACQNGKDVPGPEDDVTTLEIAEGLIWVGGNGGEYNFSYVLENGDRSLIEPVCSVSWIHDFDLTVDGTVSFVVDENIAGGLRNAHIVLKHGEVEGQTTVSQTGITPPGKRESIEITYEINGPHVRMYVTPEPEDVRWLAMYGLRQVIDDALESRKGLDLTDYVTLLLNYKIIEAREGTDYSEKEVREAISQITQFGPSYLDLELEADTEYYGFACATDDFGERVSAVEVKMFRTE